MFNPFGRHDELPFSEFLAAERRVKEGYRLPNLPEGRGQWNEEWDRFAFECTTILKQRKDDYRAVGGTGADERRNSDAIVAFNVGVVQKSIELVTLHHRLVLEADQPKEIMGCLRSLRVRNPEADQSVVTEAHLHARENIRAHAQMASYKNSRVMTSWLIERMTEVAFEDLSQVDRILILMDRGMLDPVAVRETLADFTGISTPVVDGAL